MKNISVAIALLAASLALCCCTNTRYVPTEVVRTEYREADTIGLYNRLRSYFESMYSRETSSDSVIDRQKETVVLKENGDTTRHDTERIVYVASRREKELERDVRQRDSIIESLRLQLASVKADSIPVPYPVEPQLSRWEQAKMDLGGIALGAVAVALSIAVVWLIKKFRR